MKITRILFIFLLFVFSCTVTHGQSWLWIKQGALTSSNSCIVSAVATDKYGNAYETGYFQDTVTFGSFTLSSFGQNIFIVKYNALGNVIWALQSKIIKDSSNASGNAITVDASGNIYVTGNFMGSVTFGLDTLSVQLMYGAQGIFVIKYNASGNIIWDEQSYPVSQYSNVAGIAIDTKSNIYITGYFEDSIKFGNKLLMDSLFPEVFSIKFNANGTPLWARKSVITGTINSFPIYVSTASVATDIYGDVFIGGNFAWSTVKFGAFTLYTLPNGGFGNNQLFIVKYDSLGNVLWAKQTEPITTGSGESGDCQIATDNKGNLLVAGSISGTVKFDTTTFSEIGLETGECLLKLDPFGNLLWGKSNSIFTSTSGVIPFWYPSGVAADTLNNIFFIEEGLSDNAADPFNIFPSPQNYTLYLGTSAFNINNYDGYATLLVKYDPTGNILCSSIVNGACISNSGDFQTIAVSPGGGSLYFASSMLLESNYQVYSGDSVVFSSDTFKYATLNNDIPFIAKWQPCCPFNASNYDTVKCPGTQLTLTADGGNQYHWSTGNTTSSIIVYPGGNTMYKVGVTNNGCMDTIFVKLNSTGNVCCDSSIIRGKNVQLISSGGGSYTWNPPSGLSCDTCPNPVASPTRTTTYTLTVTSDSGCVSTKYVTIDVSCGDVFIPNAFSPNESHNNILYVHGSCIQNLYFIIYDRWGNKMFESDSPEIGWDGNHNGAAMNTGTYMYYAKATLYDGSTIEKHGNVTLVR